MKPQHGMTRYTIDLAMGHNLECNGLVERVAPTVTVFAPSLKLIVYVTTENVAAFEKLIEGQEGVLCYSATPEVKV